jgi:acetoin utilization protein AcuB
VAITVDEIMTRAVVTVRMDDTLRTARGLLEHGGFHHLLVAEHGKLVGVLSDRDVLRATSPFLEQLSERVQDTQTLERRVHQLMSRGLITAFPHDSIRDAAIRMLDGKISCLPVITEHNAIVGIVTWRDMLRWFTRAPEPSG